MRLGKLWTTAAVFGAGIALMTCSTGPGNTGRKDAGHQSADVFVPECVETFDCVEGDCKEGRCVKCTADTCTAGQTCDQYFKCIKCVGSACGVGDASVAACTTRAECPSGQICKSKKCQAPSPNGTCLTNDECVAGQVCNYNASPSVCIVGCFSNADCKGMVLDGGLPAPHCDNQVTNQCGPCVSGDDCALGELCQEQRCQVAPECVPPDRSKCGDRACIQADGGGYLCGPCSTKEQCGSGYDCVGGRCEEVSTGCTNDDPCKTISPGHFCDRSTGQCEWGCLPRPTDAGFCPNCCTGDKECDTNTHKCSDTACSDCNPPCMGMGEVCDTASCSCRKPGDTDGGTAYPPCNKDDCSGCPSGTSCYCAATAVAQEYKCSQLVSCNPGVIALDAYCK
ncbi:MAG: hypothetical protein QM765_20530 [Myxococcales bacterium]